MLALGLFTRPVALVIVVFLLVANFERWQVEGTSGTSSGSNTR